MQRKLRTHATNWLELAEKVEHYRRDLLESEELNQLRRAQGELKRLVREKADASKLKLGIEELEAVLRRTGGAFYPKSTLTEYVEFFLVAAIVILGIRAYFFQPFKIPTNSMWPSYNGMTGEVFVNTDDEPGFIGQGFRFVTQLAVPKRVDAPVGGEVKIPVARTRDGRVVMLPPRFLDGRKWFVIPTKLREYELYVDNTPVKFRVPGDFDLENVVLDAYFDGAESFPVEVDRLPFGQGVLLPTGKKVQAGDRMLSFDVLTGDQLFVDRISYHFVKPQVGDGFVFRTDHLTRLHPQMPPGSPKEQYYIKRLVGTPGDEMEIREPELWRNGEPIEGSEAFAANAKREGRYPGYRWQGDFEPGVRITVPPHRYLAMGDNSASSLDGRSWGTIPDKDVVGRPLFIYYPFTRRWGPAP